MFKEIKTLFIVQLKEKMDLSFLKSIKKTLFKVALYLIAFIALVALSYLILFLCQYLNLFSALNKIPLSFITMIFFIIFIVNIITCTYSLSKSLYSSEDNKFLVTLPVNPNSIFLSKMLVFYIGEIRRAFIILIPVLIGYGMISSLPFYYYPLMIIFIVLFSIFPVLIAGLLSIPANYIIRFINRYSILKVSTIVLLILSIMIPIIAMIDRIPSNINIIKSWSSVSQFIRNFLNSFTTGFFTPFFLIVECICGVSLFNSYSLFSNLSYIVPLILIGIAAVLVVLNIFTSRPLYLHMITKSFEYNKKEKRVHKKNIKLNEILSSILYETERKIKNTSTLIQTLIFLFLVPIGTLLINKIYSAIDTKLLGTYLTIAFNVLIITLFITMNNVNVSSILSSDSDGLYLNKIKVQSPNLIIYPRMFYNFVTSLIMILTSSIIFFTFSSLKIGDCILMFFTFIFIISTHIIWSCDFDLTNPKHSLFKVNGNSTINPNEVKSSILSLLLSVGLFGITIFFLNDGNSLTFVKLFFITLALLVLRIYLLNSKMSIEFKEIAQ